MCLLDCLCVGGPCLDLCDVMWSRGGKRVVVGEASSTRSMKQIIAINKGATNHGIVFDLFWLKKEGMTEEDQGVAGTLINTKEI